MADNVLGRFKLNVFGGFNRKDVIEYIESIYSEISDSERENRELRARYESLEMQLDRAEKMLKKYEAGTACDDDVPAADVSGKRRVKVRRRTDAEAE